MSSDEDFGMQDESFMGSGVEPKAERGADKFDLSDDSDDEEECESTDFKRRLGKLLCTAFPLETQGAFAGSGPLKDAPNPGLSIEGLGSIGLPLSVHDAERIVSHSEQAPFGRRDQTIVDLSVRKTWQIDGSKIQFLNDKWESYIKQIIVPTAARKLGLEAAQVDTRLYKLLLYGEGGHFEAHQDTEKEEGMFGTLIIVLPSPFTGGIVTASNGSQEIIFDTASNSHFGTFFTCIYSDIFHKVHPVETGYRFVLSYNLIFQSSSMPKPCAPRPGERMNELRNLLKEWPEHLDNGKDLPRFIVHALEHNYSKVGLRFDNMKGNDRPKVSFLRDIADELGFSIYISQIDIVISGRNNVDSPIGDYDYDYRMEDIDERSYKLESAVDPHGNETDLSRLSVEKYDGAPYLSVSNWKADDRERDGFTGNEGCDVKYYYHRSVVLMWPKNQNLYMQVKAGGVESAVSELKNKTSVFGERTQTSEAREDNSELRTYTRAVIDAYFTLADYREIAECVDAVASASLVLNDVKKFLQMATSSNAYRVAFPNWVAAIESFGFAIIKNALDELLKSSGEKNRPIWRCQFLEQLSASFPQDEILQSWVNDNMQTQLLNLPIFDGDAIEILVKHIKRVSFSRCQDMLSSYLKTKDARIISRPDHLSGSLDISSVEIVVKIFKETIEDESASEWCRDQLLHLMDDINPSSKKRLDDLKKVALFIQLCIKHHHQSYVPMILQSFRKLPYTFDYLDSIVGPFAASLRPLLDEKSLSFGDPLFSSFATHFLKRGSTVLQIQTTAPPVPDFDFTLQTVGNEYVDSFLESSVQHTLSVTGANSIRDQVKSALSSLGKKISVRAFNGNSPDVLHVRKMKSHSRKNAQLTKLLTKKTHEEWQNAICGVNQCDYCKQIQRCLDWYKDHTAYQRFCSAFGTEETVKELLGPDEPTTQPTTQIPPNAESGSSVPNTQSANTAAKKVNTVKSSEKNEPLKKRNSDEVIDLTVSPVKPRKKIKAQKLF